MVIPIKARSSLEIGSCFKNKVNRSNRKTLFTLKGHSLEQKSMKLCQNFDSHKFKSSSKLGYVGSETRSLGQIMQKTLCTLERAQF